MSYLDTINLLETRRTAKFNGIPTTFQSLRKVLPAWDKGTTTIISGGTGTGD